LGAAASGKERRDENGPHQQIELAATVHESVLSSSFDRVSLEIANPGLADLKNGNVWNHCNGWPICSATWDREAGRSEILCRSWRIQKRSIEFSRVGLPRAPAPSKLGG
jgi:hypothetical protein